MFLPKDAASGNFPLDPEELPFTEDEIIRARRYLQLWHSARRKPGEPQAGACPHEDLPCKTIRECVEKIAWWRRYVLEIEAAS